MVWNVLSPGVPKTQDELRAVLLKNRGLTTKKSQENFLHPVSPLELSLKDVGLDGSVMKRAVALITEAKEKKWNVIVFGDYDADGICATAVLWETLFEMEIHALPFIPDRERHGYGLSIKAITDLVSEHGKPDLLITVDNGIVAHDAFEHLKTLGVKTILTDHHQLDIHGAPSADVILHTTALCGTTTAWMLARALDPKKAELLLDLCGIATIADQVPLLNANRSFAKFGIEAIRRTTRPGLHMLMDTAGIKKEEVNTYTINYGIAPRINAMGRVGDPKDALRSLCGKNAQKLQALASAIQDTNTLRQDMTFQFIQKAKLQKNLWITEHVIIVEDEAFHEGVIGLIAGKLAEEFGKPAIAIARGETTAKASARSIAGVNITEFLRQVRDDLIDIGGHPMAAGFSLLAENIAKVKKQLEVLAKEQINLELLQKKLDVECELRWNLISEKTVQVLQELEPHGAGNVTPLFSVRGGRLIEARRIGKEFQHCKLVVQPEDNPNQFLTVLAFGMGEVCDRLTKGEVFDLAIQLKLNVWNGRKEVQGVAKDIKNA